MGNNGSSEITYQLYDPRTQRDQVDEIWARLCERAPHSFFLSPGWTALWLDTLPAGVDVFLFVAQAQGAPFAAGFFGAREVTRHGAFRIRQLSLNHTLDDDVDSLTLEYNGMLVDPSAKISLLQLIDGLSARAWDELLLPLLAVGDSPELSDDIAAAQFRVERKEISSYFVDLDQVRERDMEFLALVSKNKRVQIRRSLKEYEKEGEVILESAGSTSEALAMLDELRELHQAEWQQRGLPGAFSIDYFNDFHRGLIERRFDSGEIQLLRVRAGANTVGVLYNFIYRGQVLFYQSGLAYREGNVYRPGLVSHHLAVRHNASLGHRSYDFLAGEGQYKKSLATGHATMTSVRVQRNQLKLLIEDRLKRIYRSLRSQGAS